MIVPKNENPAPSVNGCRAHKDDQPTKQINSQNSHIEPQQQGAIESLVGVHLSWGIPGDELICSLLDRGVSEQAMIRPWCIGAGRVRYHGQVFVTDPYGSPAITFRAEDRGLVTDLIAWDLETGRLASWRGQAFCLGNLDEVLNPATYFGGDALWVHETPLEWLLAERRGIVIMRPELCNVYLAHARRLAAPTLDFALKLKQRLQPPRTTAELYVRAWA